MEYDDLSREERDAFAALPSERIPPFALEERTVRALRERGWLRSAGRETARLPWIAATAVAASLAAFFGGLAVGQSLGARQTAEALARVYPDETAQAAAVVQHTGSAHRSALAALAEAAESADPKQVEQAREVALATFWAAAAEIVRLAPDDPLAATILRELERARSPAAEAAGSRSVVWF